MDEAKAWRLRKKFKPKKGEFKELNPGTFKDLAHQFNLAPTTVNRNYNEAMKYHKLRKLKKSKKTGESAEQEEEEMAEMIETSGEFSDEEDTPGQEEAVVELEGEMSKLPVVPKQEPIEQTLAPVNEQQ